MQAFNGANIDSLLSILQRYSTGASESFKKEDVCFAAAESEFMIGADDKGGRVVIGGNVRAIVPSFASVLGL